MDLKKKYTNHLSWYLYSITIKTEAQGKGISTKLVKPMLDYCDLNNKPCYLETNKDNNVMLYEHYGFELLEKTFIPNSKVSHHVMLRKPIQKD